MQRILVSTLLAAAAGLLASCAGPKFHQQYDQLVAETGPPYTDVTGPWEGKWVSGHNQHDGQLKAIVSAAPDKQDRYRFLYWATWGKGMKATFNFEGDAIREGDVVKISGEKGLGPIKYNHEAELTPTTFKATFGSDDKDFGVMNLKRPE